MDETTHSNVTFFWGEQITDYPKSKPKAKKKYVEPVNEHTFYYSQLEEQNEH